MYTREAIYYTLCVFVFGMSDIPIFPVEQDFPPDICTRKFLLLHENPPLAGVQ